MSRIQLALNVDDIDAAVDFYAKLFNAQPAKRRPGYANFALDEPALKLVLLENPGQGGTLNHLGVEVGSTDEVTAATQRLAEQGLGTAVEQKTTCCYAVQDKVWVDGPGGEPWEIYTVLADDRPDLEGQTSASAPDVVAAGDAADAGPALAGDGTCCASAAS